MNVWCVCVPYTITRWRSTLWVYAVDDGDGGGGGHGMVTISFLLRCAAGAGECVLLVGCVRSCVLLWLHLSAV